MIPFDVFSPIIEKVLSYIPDPQKKAEAQAAAIKAAADHEETILKLLQESDIAQAAINQEEAKSGDRFKSYPRPLAMWVAVFGLAWNIVPVVVGQFFIWFGHPAPSVIQLPEFVINTLLYGLLGLGAYRTYEKKNGVN